MATKQKTSPTKNNGTQKPTRSDLKQELRQMQEALWKRELEVSTALSAIDKVNATDPMSVLEELADETLVARGLWHQDNGNKGEIIYERAGLALAEAINRALGKVGMDNPCGDPLAEAPADGAK